MKVHELSERIHGLSERVHELSERVHELSEQIHGLSEQIHGLSEQIHELSEQIHELSERIHELSERIHETSGPNRGCRMKFYSRTLVLLFIVGMPFGYDPVTDTLGSVLGLDFLAGKSDYYTGCHNPKKIMEFQEIHLGYGTKLDENLSVHLDGGLIPTTVSPLDEFRGGRETFGYISGRCDVDWQNFGLGFGLGNVSPYIEPYARVGVRKYLYLNAGLAHRYPLGGSGVANVGLGSGLGTDKVNVWIGLGTGLRCGGLVNDDFGGYSASLDCRVTGNFGLRAGALRGYNNSESAWLGVSYYFK